MPGPALRLLHSIKAVVLLLWGASESLGVLVKNAYSSLVGPKNLYFQHCPLGLYRLSEYLQLLVTNSNSDWPAVGKLIISQTGVVPYSTPRPAIHVACTVDYAPLPPELCSGGDSESRGWVGFGVNSVAP